MSHVKIGGYCSYAQVRSDYNYWYWTSLCCATYIF